MSERSPEVARIQQLLLDSPVFDTEEHPAQLLIGEESTEVLVQMVVKFDALSADVLRLTARSKSSSPLLWFPVLQGCLKSDLLEVRESAIEAVEQWSDTYLCPVLLEHRDPVPYLERYRIEVIKDILKK